MNKSLLIILVGFTILNQSSAILKNCTDCVTGSSGQCESSDKVCYQVTGETCPPGTHNCGIIPDNNTCHLPNITQKTYQKPVLVSYVDKCPTTSAQAIATALGVPGYAAKTDYNVIIIAFWCTTAAYDAAQIWANPIGFGFGVKSEFGSTNEDIRCNMLKKYHEAGIKVLISAFGAAEWPTTLQKDPVKVGNDLGQFALDMGFDGVDIDYEDNNAMFAGTGEQWLITMQKTLRQKLPEDKYIVTHAPQAPYFSGITKLIPNGAYLTVDKEVGDTIDWYNMQFYNQGATKYETYETLFIKADGDAATGKWFNSSMMEIAAKGVDIHKIAIGKPVTPGDADNSGWVSASSLASFASQGKSQFGWNTGFMTWQLSSDSGGYFIGTASGGLSEKEENFLDE